MPDQLVHRVELLVQALLKRCDAARQVLLLVIDLGDRLGHGLVALLEDAPGLGIGLELAIQARGEPLIAGEQRRQIREVAGHRLVQLGAVDGEGAVLLRGDAEVGQGTQ